MISGDSDVRLCRVSPMGLNELARTVSEKAITRIPRALLNSTNRSRVGASLSVVK